MKDYSLVCRDAFSLVDDIGNGSFNNKFSQRGTMATTVEVAMPVVAVFRNLDPNNPASVEHARAELEEIAQKEQGVFSRYSALATFALGESIVVQ